MVAPVFVGQPSADRTFAVTPYGQIRCGGPCRDDYTRINHYHDANGRIITLQAAAIASFKAAEHALGHPIIITGSLRSCAYQTQLHNEDPVRFANPNTSAHCRGLAIDVWNPVPADVRQALERRRWYQARPDSEPWHFSFGIEV